ncbi:MAG: peptide deformylase [Bacteroidales bacterium]|nr:peptide deformylase [Bacteroidales bacterium]
MLPVYVYGMSVLRKVSLEIDKDYEGLDQLINDLYETMVASDGVGLAAPQVGKSIRIFVVDASRMEDIDDEPDLKDFKKVFINPQIIDEWGEKWSFTEGCLSIPNIREDVSRHSNVRIEYYDEHWNFHEEEYDGVRARIIQHEYDHLNGRLFVDLINPLRKKLIANRLKSISKGNVDCDYKIIYPVKK